MNKGLRINHLSKCSILRSYGELRFKGYVLLLELLERVMVSKGLRVNHLSKCIIIRRYKELWFKGYVLLLE